MKGEKLLERIARLERLSPAERRLADVFEREYREVAFSNLVGIGEKAGVGTATVTRFIRKLGYAGFAVFMKALREEVSEALDSPISHYIRTPRWEEGTEGAEFFFLKHFQGVAGNLHRSMRSVNPAMFEKAVDLLADTRRQIYVTGGGTAQALASYFVLLAQYFRDDVRLLEPNVGSLGQQLAGVRPRAVLLCIAYHRCSKISLQLMELFRRFGGCVILVTDRSVTPLNRLADASLVVHSEGGAGMFSSRSAGLALLEALLAALAPRQQEIIPGRFERMEEVFSTIEGFAYPDEKSPRFSRMARGQDAASPKPPEGETSSGCGKRGGISPPRFCGEEKL